MVPKGMARQTLMHIFQFAEGSYLFHIYHNYNNLFFSIGEKEKRIGFSTLVAKNVGRITQIIENKNFENKILFNDPRCSFLNFGTIRYTRGLNMKKQNDT